MNKNKFVEELKKLNIPVTEEKMHQLDKYASKYWENGKRAGKSRWVRFLYQAG